MAIATGLAIAAGVGAAGALGGAALSSSAQKKAANKAANSAAQTAEMNNALALDIYGKNQSNLSPFITQGAANSTKLNALLANAPNSTPLRSQFVNSAMNPGSFTNFRNSTGYDFRLNEGLDAINTGYGARGTLQSGAAMKDIMRFGQDFASNEYGKYINQLDRYASYGDAWNAQERGFQTDQRNNYLGQLANQQAVGLAGASALAGVGQNYVNTVSANNNSAGTAAANAALARGAASQNMYGGVANALGNAAGMYAYGGQSPLTGGLWHAPTTTPPITPNSLPQMFPIY